MTYAIGFIYGAIGCEFVRRARREHWEWSAAVCVGLLWPIAFIVEAAEFFVAPLFRSRGR
jgi:hypothetical protein